MDKHEIDDTEVESSVETLAIEYNKQDGIPKLNSRCFIPEPFFRPDALMKVSADILQRVYESLQDQGQGGNDFEKESIDPDSHLFVVDAFEMPLWHWSQERGTFEK